MTFQVPISLRNTVDDRIWTVSFLLDLFPADQVEAVRSHVGDVCGARPQVFDGLTVTSEHCIECGIKGFRRGCNNLLICHRDIPFDCLVSGGLAPVADTIANRFNLRLAPSILRKGCAEGFIRCLEKYSVRPQAGMLLSKRAHWTILCPLSYLQIFPSTRQN